MYAQRNDRRKQFAGAAAYKRAESRSHAHALSEISDNRSRTTALSQLQSQLEFSNFKNQNKLLCTLKNSALLARESSAAASHWEILELSDYLRRHKLKPKNTKVIEGVTTIQLTDGSRIHVEQPGFWRHEFAEKNGIFFDSAHAVNKDSALTTFWTRKAYAMFRKAI